MARGGVRPGAGRKKKSTVERQESNLGILLAMADSETVRTIGASVIAEAQAGDVRAFLALAPYLFGSPTQKHEHEHGGTDGGPLVFSLHLGDAEPTG